MRCLPVKGDSSAADSFGRARVDENGVDVRVQTKSLDPLAEIGTVVHDLKNPDRCARPRGEVLLEPCGERWIFRVMELDPGEGARDDGLDDGVKTGIDEHADLLNAGRQRWSDRTNLVDGDLARAGGKDKADRIGSSRGGELRVGQAGVGADLDPHRR